MGRPTELSEDHRRIPAGANGYDDLEYRVETCKKMVYFARPTAWAGTPGHELLWITVCAGHRQGAPQSFLAFLVTQVRNAPNAVRVLYESGGPAMAA